MSSPTTAPPGFSNDDLVQLLDLLKGADSVELKLTVPEPHQRSTVGALGLDPLEAQIRQVFFFDTPDLDLDAARRRRPRATHPGQGRRLGRQAAPGRAERAARGAAALRRASASRSTRFPAGSSAPERSRARPTRTTCASRPRGALPLRKLFSKEQRQLFAAHAPEGIGLDDLTVLGPIFVLKLRLVPPRISGASSWRRCGSTRTAPASSSCRRALRRTRRSRSRPRRAPSSPSTASTSRASRRRRPARRSSTSPRASKEKS